MFDNDRDNYDWFLAEVEAQDGIMDTSYATLNYVTLEELTELESRGIILRKVDTEQGTDLIFTPEAASKVVVL